MTGVHVWARDGERTVTALGQAWFGAYGTFRATTGTDGPGAGR